MTREEWDERFAVDENNGSYLLTSHGCFQRHKIVMFDQLLTEAENKIRNLETRLREEWNEQLLQNKAVELFNKGCQLRENESMEQFVLRCEEV
jgi:hypothetical protein